MKEFTLANDIYNVVDCVNELSNSWSFFGKLTVSQLVKKFPTIYGI